MRNTGGCFVIKYWREEESENGLVLIAKGEGTSKILVSKPDKCTTSTIFYILLYSPMRPRCVCNDAPYCLISTVITRQKSPLSQNPKNAKVAPQSQRKNKKRKSHLKRMKMAKESFRTRNSTYQPAYLCQGISLNRFDGVMDLVYTSAKPTGSQPRPPIGNHKYLFRYIMVKFLTWGNGKLLIPTAEPPFINCLFLCLCQKISRSRNS